MDKVFKSEMDLSSFKANLLLQGDQMVLQDIKDQTKYVELDIQELNSLNTKQNLILQGLNQKKNDVVDDFGRQLRSHENENQDLERDYEDLQKKHEISAKQLLEK